MGIFGEGGTGKSTLIDAVRAWFKFCGREQELIVTATTGAAASKINGCTVHSATGIPFERKKGRNDEEEVHITSKMKDWTDRNYMIVDEVSMMDTEVIASISTKLGTAESLQRSSEALTSSLWVTFCNSQLCPHETCISTI